jgi:homoserine kinase type II
MAVYTHLGADQLADLISRYDVGDLRSAKGIAEGVSNSNWLVETDRDRFILTMYESRTELADLPFFLGLLDHLAARNCPVPRTIHDREGAPFRMIQGKAVALIEFLPGVSVDKPDIAQARAVGQALAAIHLASSDFTGDRPNRLGLNAWHSLLADCGAEGLSRIDPSLPTLANAELAYLTGNWPINLPRSVIHADLFPDNVLMLGDRVSGLIDFYFACTDITAYDLAVTHAAWCFDANGSHFYPEIAAALVEGYESVRPLLDDEWTALPILARGAAMRFLATRSYDWLHPPHGALVTPKDPMAFARRSLAYADMGREAFPRTKG